MFAWSKDYAVDIQSVDAQHQNLFRIAAELHAAMLAGQGKSVLARILDRLVQYTSAHFSHEERLMRLHNYPDLAAHVAEHEALKKQVLKFQSDYQQGHVTMTVQLLQFLQDWLTRHIRGVDRKYAPLLKEKAVA